MMMKSYRPIILLMIFLLILICRVIPSQADVPLAPAERVEACTDRTLYISGEKIFFSALVVRDHDTSSTEFSKILYAELTTPDGNKVAGGKFRLENFSGQGCLTIPEESVTGIYYMRFYTRFMRNFPADRYKYIILKIINPNKAEVLTAKSEQDEADSKKPPQQNTQNENPGMTISPEKTKLTPGEMVRINIRCDVANNPASRLCLSVVPEGAVTESSFEIIRNSDSLAAGMYYPETRGITLSGQLVEKERKNPVPGSRINLSILGEKDIQVTHSDSAGKFYFSLPGYTGRKDIFLCAEDLQETTPEILIDNDFCSKQALLRAPRFSLPEEEMRTALQMAVNARINAVFSADTLTPPVVSHKNDISFYGTPAQILTIDKYIDLPTLGDYFAELPVIVKVRKNGGKKQFRFQSGETDLSAYDPLVLVDWVAVSDITKILAMSPALIDRIELVDALWLKGDITYGGIISFISKKNDFAGIDLPASGTFVNYAFTEACESPVPITKLSPELPDARNTVYWDPAVQLNAAGQAEVVFPAPETPGRYVVILRNMNKMHGVAEQREIVVVICH